MVNYQNPLCIDLTDLNALHAVGIAGGELWSAGSERIDDLSFINHKWSDKLLKYPGSFSISVGKSGNATPPESSENETAESMKSKLDKCIDELKKIELKECNIETNKGSYQDAKFLPKTVKVLLNGKRVFEAVGEHIQFQVDFNQKDDCIFSIYNRISSSDEKPESKYHAQMSEGTDILIRFGS